MNKIFSLRCLTPALALLALASGAQASGTYTNWSDSLVNCTPNGTSADACSTSSNVSGEVKAITGIASTSTSSGSSFALRTLETWSGGIGVSGTNDVNTPQHAIDNKNYVDAVMLEFDSSVILDTVTLGWRYNDWDFSIFRYTGAGTPSTSAAAVGNMKLNTTLGGGWELVSSFAGGNTSETGKQCNSSTNGAVDGAGACGNTTVGGLNTNNYSSSWWVISAYSSAYGTSPKVGTGGLGQGNDYFKLLSVAGKQYVPPVTPPGQVPEPGSLALVGLALAGVYAARRRRQQAA